MTNFPAAGCWAPSPDRYERMAYVRCGTSGLKLPRISLGLWNNFGAVTPFATAREMLLTAFDLGITHLDVANNYGPHPGAAEETLGRVMQSDLKPHRDDLIITTKAGYVMQPGPYGDGGSRKYLISSLDASLRRMNLDYVDIFYHHRPDPNTPMEETMRTLADMVHQGKVLYVGVSNYSARQTAQAAALLANEGVPLTIHQPRYNLLDRWIERQDPMEEASSDGTPAPTASLCDVLLRNGIGAAVFSPLAQGLLTDRYLNGIPEDSRAASSCVFLQRSQITEELLGKLHRLNELACARGETLAQLSLAWVLENPAITTVITGASRPEQIRQNARTLEHHAPLTEAEKAMIRDILG